MHRDKKTQVVAEISQLADSAKAVVATGFSGLTVEAETKLRRQIREAEATYRVVRCTLARRALDGERWGTLRGELEGNTALAFTEGDPVALMKALVDFSKENKALTIKCGVLQDDSLSADEVKTLASLPPRDVLLAQLLGVMESPLRGLVTVMSGPVRNLAQVVKAIADKQGEGAGAPADVAVDA